MKRTLFFGLMLLFPLLAHCQYGFVSGGGNDPASRSSFTLGQLFDYGVSSANGYANEGLQQPFLYRGTDTLLYENSSYPVAYRPADRIPAGNPQTLNVGLTPTYLLPTQGLDSLIDVMAYGVTFTNDTTVVAPYSVCEHNFDLQQPLVLPAGSVPPVQYYNNVPATYPVGVVTPVTWHFSVADKSLTDIQQVNVKFPPCGTDNYRVYTAAATSYPFVEPVGRSYRAEDYELNQYQTVRIGCDCWTKENLQSAFYSDGAPIANPMAYVSAEHPDASANVARYGYLYSWNDAVRAPLAPDADGSVQGVCPQGWHLPTAEEFAALAGYSAFDLMTTTLWLNGNGTDATGFSARPAGKYTGLRFENLLGETNFWTSTTTSATAATYCSLTHGCDQLLQFNDNVMTGKSVRCLKD